MTSVVSLLGFDSVLKVFGIAATGRSSATSGQQGNPAGGNGGETDDATRALLARLAEHLAQTAPAAVRLGLTAEGAGVETVECSEFLASIDEPTCAYLLGASRPDRPSPPEPVWVSVEPPLAMRLVEAMLGGAAATTPPAARPLTALERRLLHRLIDAVCEALARAARSGPWRFTLSGAGRGCSAAGQRCRVLALHVRAGRADGRVRLCLTPELLARMLAEESAQASLVPADGAEISACAHAELDGKDLAALAAGDVLVTDAPADGEIVVRVDGRDRFAGRLARWGDRSAVYVTRKLDAPPPADERT